MNATLRGFVPALAIGLAACGSSKSAQVPPPTPIAAPECPGPAWTCFQSGPCPFPEFKDSLCAVGIADQISSYSLGMEAAKTRARREMAAVVQSQVDGFTRATQDSLAKSGAGDDSIQKVQDLAQNVVDEWKAEVARKGGEQPAASAEAEKH